MASHTERSHIKTHKLQQIKCIIQTNIWGHFGPHKLVSELHFNVYHSRKMSEDHGKPVGSANEGPATSMSNTMRVFLVCCHKAYQRGGQQDPSHVYVYNQPASQPATKVKAPTIGHLRFSAALNRLLAAFSSGPTDALVGGCIGLLVSGRALFSACKRKF